MQYATSMLREWWNSDTGYTAEDFAPKQRGDAASNEILKALHDAGARLLVGTDTPHPFLMPGFSVHEELAVAAGFSPYEALKAATADAAEFMGVPGEFGTVKPGARADLVLVAGNPLDVNNSKRIVGVMLRGHCYLEMNCCANSTLCHYDLRKVVSEPAGQNRRQQRSVALGKSNYSRCYLTLLHFQNPTAGDTHEITHSVVCSCSVRLVEQFGPCSTRYAGAACAAFRN